MSANQDRPESSECVVNCKACRDQGPPRIPEPGRWGIVEAHVERMSDRRVWVRYIDTWFWGSSTATWDDLIDPVLIRAGVEGS